MFGLGTGVGRKKDLKKDLVEKADRLRADALASAEKTLLSASGIPGTADALAYEPIQGLVAIATSDGKVKLLGRPGCEMTLYSAARYPYATRQLQFLQNRGVLVRVSKGGFMECWSVASGSSTGGGVQSLGTVKVRGDKICCVADMARDPYVLLGCASGSLRIAMLTDASGSPVTQPRHARGFTVAPYRVRPQELCGGGEVRQLAVQSFGPIHRALVLFTAGMVAVWDLRAVELVTSIEPNDADAATFAPALAEAGEATAVCWIGTDRGDFATGHVDGSVLVWALPGLDAGVAVVAAVMRVVAGAAEPVRMLRCVFGEVDGLLVLGGQEVEQPEGLTWLPLPAGPEDAADDEGSEEDPENDSEEGDEDGEARGSGRAVQASRRHRSLAGPNSRGPRSVKLPWFGHLISFCLVVEGGCVTGYEHPAAVLQLVEGGQLVLYNLQEEHPCTVTPYFQQRTTITATDAPLVPVRRPSGCSSNAISLSCLRKVAAAMADDDDEDPSGIGAFACGKPPAPPADATWGLVYCTGYKDGGVCLWDVQGGTTRLLCAAPAGEAMDEIKRSSGSSGSVTCLSLVWPTGLLLAGHHKGEVRMYQFSATERQADCATLESINTTGSTRPLLQQPGLQLRLRVLVNSGEITSLAYCQSIRAVAAGDKAGGVALIDTAKPLVRWYAMPGQQAVLACALAPLPLPPARLRVPEVSGEEGAPSHAVVIADSEGRLAALDAARGCFVGRSGELCPKNHSYTLTLELLDEHYMPLWSRSQLGAGCDQAALGGSGCSTGSSRRSKLGHGSRARAAGSDEEEDESVDESRTRTRGGASGRRHGAGRSRGRSHADDEDQDDEDEDELDVDALLAKAAMHVDRSRALPPHRNSVGDRSRESSKRGDTAAFNETEDTSSSAPVLSSCPDPTGRYVLLVTDQYLRVYTAGNVIAAERATVAKRAPAAQQQLVYARPVQVAGAPGVMALASAEHGLCVQVYSLPSLDLLYETPLSASLSWFWDVPPGHERRLGRLAATSRLGHLMLLGLGNELLTLGLAGGLYPPAAPTALFDAAAAAASLAAAASYEEEHRAQLGRLARKTGGQVLPGGPEVTDSSMTASEAIDGVDSPVVRTEGRRVDKGPVGAATALVATERVAGAAKEANVTLTRVFNRVQQGLTRAVEETTRGVKQLATNVERGVANMQAALIDGGAGANVAGGAARGQEGSARGHSAEWYASLPDLGAVFSRTVAEDDATIARMRRKQERRQQQAAGGAYDEDDDDDVSILSISDDDDEPQPAHLGAAAAGPRGSPASARPSAADAPPLPPPATAAARRAPQMAPRSVGGDDSAMRNELFGGTRPYMSTGGAATRLSHASGPGTSSNPRTRTADEIKRAYGRAPADGGGAGAAGARSNEVRSVMEQNRSKLEERGEKLRNLNDKAADMENSAAGFAEMARQLAERERNKKWWQL